MSGNFNAEIIYKFYNLQSFNLYDSLQSMRNIRIAMAQINPTVGDLSGNTKKILKFIDMAKDAGADIVIFPELAVTGYPPEDLLLKPPFVEANIRHLKSIACKTR